MNKRSSLLWAVLLAGIIAIGLAGCSTPQRAALTATGVQVVTVDAAMNAWGDYVRAGAATQAQVDAVKLAYQHYYQAALVEKAAWLAYASAPTNATPAQTAQAVTQAAQGPLIQLVLGFLPPDKVAALMKGAK